MNDQTLKRIKPKKEPEEGVKLAPGVEGEPPVRACCLTTACACVYAPVDTHTHTPARAGDSRLSVSLSIPLSVWACMLMDVLARCRRLCPRVSS